MRNSCTPSINLNVNLINFPSPIQLSMHQKMTKSSLHQPKAKNINNQSLTIHKKQSPSYHQNFEDSFEEFHPTMSTESLCKVKKMYQKSIKNKGFGKSLDDFLNADVEDIVRKNSKTAAIKELNAKNQLQSNLGSRQNTSKSNHNSQNSSKVSSRNSTEHLVSKQPQEIQCYNTFQEDEDFVKFDLLKNSLNVNKKSDKVFGKDIFKKNKSKGSSYKNQKSLPSNLCDSESHIGYKPFVKSKQYKNLQENKPFSNNLQRSKSKSRSKSKNKSKEKVKNQGLRKLPSAKNIKSNNQKSRYQKSKSPIRHNTSRSPMRESQIDTRRYKENWQLKGKNQRKKSNSKSKSKSKNQKKFIRSNIQIQTSNHHTFSPSPATKRGNKSKSFQRSRSISNHKSLSKQKRSISKSANSKNVHLNRSKSPKQKKVVKEFKLQPRNFTENASRQINKSRSLSKQKHQRSVANQQKATSKEKKTNKKISQKPKMTKQYSQQVLKSSQFSKNKFNKITYGKPDTKTSPDHSRSTNFYLPQRKQSLKPKQKPEKQGKVKKQPKNEKSYKNSSKANQKSKKIQNQKKQEDFQTIKQAAVTIQRFYRGYQVRKQLNEDLRNICSRVNVVRSKIQDKRSKYWINREDGKQDKIDGESRRKKEAFHQQKILHNGKPQFISNRSNKQFQSLLSSSNSIQRLTPKSPEVFNRHPSRKQSQSDNQLLNQVSRSMTIDQNSKSQLLYFEQLVNKDLEQNERFLRESEQLKNHIRSISSEHLRSYEPGLCKENECIGQKLSDKAKEDEEALEMAQQMSKESSKNNSLMQVKSSSSKHQAQQPNNRSLEQKVAHLTNILPQPFQFYEPYSPKHYILSPKNPSPSVLRMVSPISSASSFYHNQIPFSLQSPQNILNGENLNGQGSNREHRDNQHIKERYFGAVSDRRVMIQEQEKQKEQKNEHKFVQDKAKVQGDNERRIQMLKKAFFEDKLLSPKTFQKRLSDLTSKRETVIEQKPETHQQKQEEQIPKPEQVHSIERTQTGKKLKITELTQQLQQEINTYNRENISRVLFVNESQQLRGEESNLQKNEGPEVNMINQGQKYRDKQQTLEFHQNQQYQPQSLSNLHHYRAQQQQQQQDIPQNVPQHQPPANRIRRGFPTELIFIKNYIFEFFTYIKSHPTAEKQLLTNLISVPYDNQHLLTCYRTQLAEIDCDYYQTRIEGQFLAYPYWRNLIDYEPIVGTDVFQRFSQMLEERASREDAEEQEVYFCVTQEQERAFEQKFQKQRMSLKELQRIFLMMLMDVFNEAFEEQRCAYRQTGLVKHQKGGMANEHTVRQALNKIQQIQHLQKSIPPEHQDPSLITHSQLALQSSQNYQFFITNSLKQKKQQLIDTIFCSVLKRVLENWGRSMCGLIIEPQDEDEMEITIEQIQVKNTERLCLALNKYVDEYERQLANVMREHELCAKLIVADKVLEALLEELVKEIGSSQRE